MKKFLLSLVAFATMAFAVSAETVTYECSELGTANVNPLASVTVGKVTFTLDKAAGSSAPGYFSNGNDIRLYAKNTMTITAAEGYKVDKLVFTYTTGFNQIGKVATTLGTVTQDESGLTWTGDASAFTFTVSEKAELGADPTKAGQFRFTKVEVTYSEGTGESDGSDTPGTGGDEPDDPETPDNPSGEGVLLTGWTNYTWTGGAQGWTANVDGYTISTDKGTSGSDLLEPDQWSIRVYQGASITVTAPAGVLFDKMLVKLDSNTKDYSGAATGWTSTTGSTSDLQFTMTSTTPQNSVTFTGGTNKQMRIAAITIYPVESDASKQPANLKFDVTTVTAGLGDPFTAPTLTKDTDAAVTYTSSNTEVATVDAATGEVSIEALGTATITATAEENAGYNAGSATYTINVVPNHVLSVAEALDLINDGYKGTAQVAGVITSIEEVSAQFGNATYNISDEGVDNFIKVYRGYWIGGEKFTAEDQLAVGAKVVVEGSLTLFNSTPEVNTGNKLISYEAPAEEGDMADFTPSYFKFYNDETADLAKMFRTDAKSPVQANLGSQATANWLTNNTGDAGAGYFNADNLAQGNVIFNGWLWAQSDAVIQEFVDAAQIFDFGGKIGKALVMNGQGSTINEEVENALGIEDPDMKIFDRNMGGNFVLSWVTDYLAMQKGMKYGDRIHVRIECNAFAGEGAETNAFTSLQFVREDGSPFGGEKAVAYNDFKDEDGNWNPYKWMVYEYEVDFNENLAGYIRMFGPKINNASLMLRSIEFFGVSPDEEGNFELELNTVYTSFNDYTPDDVEEPDQPEVPEGSAAMFDFTDKTWLAASGVELPEAVSTGADVTNKTFTVGQVSIAFPENLNSKGEPNSNRAFIWLQTGGDVQLRVYAGDNFTVKVNDADAYAITKIEFNVPGASYGNFAPAEGTAGTYENNVFTSTAEDGVSAVTFEPEKASRINTINVTYKSLSGIADVENNENAPVEYFNLQGVRVDNPENGLYIRRQGNNVTKVIIR